MTRRPLALIAVLLIALAGCSKKPSPNETPTANTALSQTPSVAPTSASPSSSPTKGATTPPPATGPRIEYFRIKTNASCPSSGPGVSYPGNPIKLEWKVVNATGVTISIDGPGLYGSYAAIDTQEIAFACNGPSNSTAKHTYYLKTVGGGASQQASLVAEAHVN